MPLRKIYIAAKRAHYSFLTARLDIYIIVLLPKHPLKHPNPPNNAWQSRNDPSAIGIGGWIDYWNDAGIFSIPYGWI